MLVRFAGTLQTHRRGILAYYDYLISTGPLEGTNNKIKTLQKQAYGFRDREFFKLKIYALHESRYALVVGGMNQKYSLCIASIYQDFQMNTI